MTGGAPMDEYIITHTLRSYLHESQWFTRQLVYTVLQFNTSSKPIFIVVILTSTSISPSMIRYETIWTGMNIQKLPANPFLILDTTLWNHTMHRCSPTLFFGWYWSQGDGMKNGTVHGNHAAYVAWSRIGYHNPWMRRMVKPPTSDGGMIILHQFPQSYSNNNNNKDKI